MELDGTSQVGMTGFEPATTRPPVGELLEYLMDPFFVGGPKVAP